MIDKDGAELAMPGRDPSTLTPPAPQAEAIIPTPAPQPVAPTPAPAAAPQALGPVAATPVAANDDDTAPVDRRLMQRGFSHAFDELLQPSTPAQNAADAAPAGEDKP